ncbi:MAG: hypothetical protein N3D81_04985 [Spirochaetes bacterium]|nr:hypothetical protein [Spirochaetota bacterium]
MRGSLLTPLLISFSLLIMLVVFASENVDSTSLTSQAADQSTNGDNTNSQSDQSHQSLTNLLEPKEIDNLLSLRIREYEPELPTNFDYIINERIQRYSPDLSKEQEIEQVMRNVESLLDEDWIIKDILLEDERIRREYYRLERPVVAVDIEQLDSRVFARGNILFGLSYGVVRKTPELLTPISSYIKENFNVNQDMRVSSTSKIGNKVSVDIEFDQKSAINRFNVSYKEPDNPPATQPTTPQPMPIPTSDDKPFVRELTFGDVSFSKPSSKYISYTAISRSAQGIKFVGKRGNFSIESIGTLSTTIPSKKSFTGTRRVSERNVRDIDFVKRKFFKLPDSNVDVSSLVLLVSVSSLEPSDVYIDGIPFRKLAQGNEYIFDRFSSEVELRYSLDRSKSLVVFYTHNSGQPITFSTNIYKGNGSDNKEYLYLFKSSLGYSPYELRNIYSLGVGNLDLSQTFEIRNYLTSDPNILASIQFSQSDYYIDVVKGIIRFNNPTPFLSNANYNIYTLSRDPFDYESTYTFKVRYFETISTYQLDFDIVENSEEVRVNGVLIPKDKYTIIYPIGRIVFRDSTLINEGDKVEISYEYRPFFGGSQKISLGAIADYQVFDFMNTKLSTGIWVSQTGGTAPRMTTAPPETGMVTSVINRIDIKRIFGIGDNKFSGYLDTEYAISVVNPNSFGAAIVDDFESNKRSLLISKDEDSWYLSSQSSSDGCYYTNRGKLYYRDYRQYYANESFTLMSYTWNIPSSQILPYSQKPGPYIASGGRLSPNDFPNVSQVSLVFDYDFSSGSWVGAMMMLNPSGVDISDLSEVMVSYRLQMDNDGDGNYEDNNTNQVVMLLQFGRFSEDMDGDGVLDQEFTTSQNGFEFNDIQNNSVITRIGSGRKGGGNGRIDTEDLDRNGRLDTNESFVSFSNIVEGSGWKQLFIPLASLSPSQVEILKRTFMVRIILKKFQGIKGRLLIDEIQLKFRTTRTYKVDGIILKDPYQIKSTSISVYDSPLYLKHRFFNIDAKTPEEKERLQEYSYIHGTGGISVSEAKSIDEASVRVMYNLSNSSVNTNFTPYQGGREGVLNIGFNSSQNFSYYSKIVFYVFIPTVNELNQSIKPSGDTLNDESIVVRFLSKERDYFEFVIPTGRLDKDKWNRLEVRIREDYRMIINNNVYDTIYPNIVGFPSFRDVNSVELGVRVDENSSEPLNIGEVWFNEIFLTDVNWLVSSAVNSSLSLSYGSEIKAFDLPLISNPYTTFFVENIFPNFRGTGGKDNVNIFSFTHYYSSDMLKYSGLNYSYSIQTEDTYQDPTLPEYLLYNNFARSFRYSIYSKHNISFLPNLSYSYSDRHDRSYQNGLLSLGTSVFLKNTTTEEIGLSSALNVSYPISLFGNVVSIRNSVDLSSVYNARNVDTRTNNVFIFSSPSFQTWSYSLGLSTGINYFFVGINNVFKHSETFSSSESNTIPFVQELSSATIPIRNQYSLTLLLEGFKERGFRREVFESDTLSLSFANILNTFNIYITPLYEFKDFNFSYTTNITRDLQMTGRITYKIDVNINRLIFSTFSLNSSHNTTFSANAIDYNLKWYDFYTNNIYRGIVAIPFYEYIGLFGYNNLSNALVFVSNLYQVRSILNQFSSAGISLSLIPFDDLILGIIPRNYNFDYSTTTVRELSSFRQLNRIVFSAVSYIPIYKLDWFIFRRTTNISVNDIIANLSYTRDEDFNTLTMKNTLNFSSSFSGVFDQQNLAVSYTLSYSYQDIMTNIPSFYSNFGIGLSYPQSLFNLLSHSVRLTYSFKVPSESDVDLVFIKVRTASVIENREEVNFYTERPWYNNNKFASFRRKVFEVNFLHETSLNFSDFVRFSMYGKLLVGQLSEIYVQNNDVMEKFFDVIPGVEFGLNVRIVF